MRTALTIAGSDSSGGAGIQADIKTMTANGVFALCAVTALTAQNTTGVTDIFDSTPHFLAEQLDAVFTDIFPDAVKIGMVSSAELIETIAAKLKEYGAKHIVVDPVMVATSGAKLLRDDAVTALCEKLLPLAEVLTPNIPEAEIRIFDFFPKAQLKKMDELGAIVMLHIPRNGRLKDPVNLAQILEIKQEFPNIRLIIAHIGRAYTKEDVGNAFETLDKAPDLMYDFCANCCEYAITEVLRHAGPKHVMYGTDMPILRMRTHRIEENGTYINLVPPGLYGDPKQDKHLREVSAEEAEKITFFLYEELLAFKRACKTLGLTKQDVEDIMYNNAHDLIEGARKSIYG